MRKTLKGGMMDQMSTDELTDLRRAITNEEGK